MQSEVPKSYCWRLRIVSPSITVVEKKFIGFKDRKFSLIHSPYGLDNATRLLTSVFSNTYGNQKPN